VVKSGEKLGVRCMNSLMETRSRVAARPQRSGSHRTSNECIILQVNFFSKILFFTCEIVERLTKGESKEKERNKTHDESYIVVEVGSRS
jgi:hypothetical protein